MTPDKIEDPRDKWQHARRIELVRYALENGHPDITEDYPKNLIIKKLKALGLPPPNVPPRPIGSGPRSGDTDLNSHHYNGSPAPHQQKTETVEIDADELMALEFEARKRRPKTAGSGAVEFQQGRQRRLGRFLGQEMAAIDRLAGDLVRPPGP